MVTKQSVWEASVFLKSPFATIVSIAIWHQALRRRVFLGNNYGECGGPIFLCFRIVEVFLSLFFYFAVSSHLYGRGCA